MRGSLVQLYCYDMSGGMAANLSALLIGHHLDAIWHTAIVVYGKEFYFDGGVGVVHESPGQTRFGAPKRIEVLGETTKTEAEFREWTQQQRRSGFGPYDYNLINRNCNHFTQEAAQFLVNRDIPDNIRNMLPNVLETPLGRMLRPMLEGLTAAPVDAGTAASQPSVQAAFSPPATVVGGLHSTKEMFTDAEEEELMLACAMLQCNELLSGGSQEGLNVTRGAIELLRRSFMNILENPTEPKYRGLLTTSQSYTTKLLPLEKFGILDILRLSGFRLRQHPSGTGQQWYLNDADGSDAILSIMVTHLTELLEAVNAEAAPSVPVQETSVCGETPAEAQELHPPVEIEKHSTGNRALEAILHDAGKPLSSLEELWKWSSAAAGPITPAVPCRQRVAGTYGTEEKPRLLVCHDMRGGYMAGDYARFALCDATASVKPAVDATYTVNYWSLVDYFVYFSHHRVSIPPKEWINAAHREGVPALATFITEWNNVEIGLLLHSAEKMGDAILQLVAICNAYNFDGYLINIEDSVDKILASRLVMFVMMLRRSLNKDRPPSSPERVVIWYDAVTIDGDLDHQNGLTKKNETFFDASNGLFTNYMWRPTRLVVSTKLAGRRAQDVYVGVDVFGRGVYGGGGYNSDKAVKCAYDAKLSVALFAPGWTLEREGGGKRETFLHSDAKMWARLQGFFEPKYVAYDTLPLWTCFRSGVGKQFYVNGERVVGEGPHTAEWCQVSQTHLTPCFQFTSSSAERGAWCVLPLGTAAGGADKADTKHCDVVPVEWLTDPVWMGDRSLRFVVPRGGAVTLLRSRIGLGGCSDNNGVLAFLDVAWWCDSSSKEHWPSRRLRVEGVSANSVSHIILDEENGSGRSASIVAGVGDWEIVRYVIPASTNWLCITSVAVLNISLLHALRCTLGGMGFLPSTHTEKESVLQVGPAHPLPAGACVVKLTKQPTTRAVQLKLPQEGKEWESFLAFARVRAGDGASVSVYMGQHEAKPTMWLELHIAPSATVEKLLLHRVSSGS
ncbi:putative endo-beta-N-acetylglucosaminidase [Trypanosoma rangeli]|uniref:Putative endo-beta-N-acetylglucosaminidase n=1 Tax=Trypanosoma rangeli TaxID=5698 RepID=A0A3R7KMJ8_TRYRA|nr:putative endo-beta-N-acetylglucosaminidase [Trypanosoma rangeli]RNF10414.1 putative endo-beta-N-acetylglucosaminidase [Trypanosoma rangeli]|eukprot:RNF10414.1 putative endo-beta-N-acetylglucosaminidase [Trypanosoma rangeli]